MAYRQFVRWIHGSLGQRIRVPIPSCVVNLVRAEYPLDIVNDAQLDYVGFKWPLFF